MRALFFMVFSILSAHLVAENATRFTCAGERGTLFLEIERQSDRLVLFNFFDGKTIWLASSASVEQLRYQLNISRANSAASGEMPTNAITGIRFSLPRERAITRVQTGGYYIPSFTNYPAQFELCLNSTLENGEIQQFYLRCMSR